MDSEERDDVVRESASSPDYTEGGVGEGSVSEVAEEISAPDAVTQARGRALSGMGRRTIVDSDRTSVARTLGSVDEAQVAPALAWPVVGVGASAGGLQAFLEILKHLAADTQMAYVLITHLARDHKSYMSEILAQHTAMKVLSIEHGVQPQTNCLYVLLPNEMVAMHEGRFVVTERDTSRLNMPVDLFFRSLASDQKNHAVGVVLSGADADGASGLKAIKGEGGIALVQTPESAQHSSMPRSSILADHVDLVLAPEDIAAELNRLGKQFTVAGVRALEEGISTPTDDEQFQRILQLLRNIAGLELRLYKPQTLRRRIARRMVLLRMDSLGEYLKYLLVRSDELITLHEEVLINVTRFFRDPEVWAALKSDVLPGLLKDRPVDRPLRIWCAGCSSGEEAYTLAITVLEYMSAQGLDTPLQIFGTDASERSIEWARTAIYPDTLAAELSPERVRRYFIKVDRGYQVSKRVRDTCIFARQNLSNDPPFSHIDVLSCRNVLIYFNQVLQRQVMTTFHYALEPGGAMLLGLSESLREYSGMFATLDRKNKIYTKVGTSIGNGFDLPRYFATTQLPIPVHAAMNGVKQGTDDQEPYSAWQDIELQRAADRTVLSRFAPPGLIVNHELTVLQVRGQTAPFTALPTGVVSWNLMRILRDEIAGQIREQVQHAVRNSVPITITPVAFDDGGTRRDLQIDVIPIISSYTRNRCFLVLFQAAGEGGGLPMAVPALPTAMSEDEKDALSAQLRLDLSTTRFHLHSLIEERDAHNQELVSANEEIQSANEELQSSNEELETTKEELQSTNEELQTVNEELQQRNTVLTQTGNDLSNLLTSVNIPLLMLTSDLKIRQFTPPMQRLLNVRASDVGRNISEIRLQLSVENIEPILLDVLETLGTRELEVQDREGRWNLLRVRPYRTAENRIEGLVVVLVDIDQLRRSQQELMESRDFISSVVESVPVPMVVVRKDCTIVRHNTAFRELTRMQSKELEFRSLPDLVQLIWGLDGFYDKLVELKNSQDGRRMEFEHHSATKDRRILLIKGQSLIFDGDPVVLLLIEDITARRVAEEYIVQQKLALEEQVQTAATELDRTQEELRGLTNHLFTAQEEERQHVARELHDDVSQRLSALELMLRDLQPAAGDAKLTEARELLQTLNTDVRSISHRLHPAILDDLGLPAALKALVAEFGERERMPATFQSSDVPEESSRTAAAALYRIAQEALRNVSKHAGKTHVKVLLEGREPAGRQRTLHLEVLDLGVGFDQESGLKSDGLGLISMKERARLAHGTFAVESALGRGTRVVVDVPIEVTV